MADDGFDFHKPQRKEAKRFEPPPWEREAFEELERRRAEERQAEGPVADESSAEGRPGQQAEAAAAASETGGSALAGADESAGAHAAKGDEPAEGAVGDAAQEPQKPELDEKQVTEMLAGLSAQEPSRQEGFWKIALGSAIIVGAIGAVLIIWAMAALVGARKSGATGLVGGLVLLVFGAGFVLGGLWTALRTLRERGVL